MIYIICFFCTLLMICFFTKRTLKYKSFLYIIAVMPLVLLATFRADSVGIDVLVYIKQYFIYAVKANSFVEYNYAIDTELGYKIVNYIISRFTDKICVLHFVNALLITVPIILGLKKLEKNIPIAFAIFTYCMMFYNYNTMTQVRQGIAMSWIFCGTICFFESEKRKGVFAFAVAILFHTTSFIGEVVIVYVLFLQGKGKNCKVKIGISILILMVLVKYYQDIIFLILKYLPSGFSMKYANYMRVESEKIHSGIGTLYIGTKIICIIIIFVLLQYSNMNKKLNFFLLGTQIISIILIPAANSVDFGYRILRYFDIFEVLIFPQVIYIPMAKKRDKFVLSGIGVMYLCLYWGVSYVIKNQGGTLPYLFA